MSRRLILAGLLLLVVLALLATATGIWRLPLAQALLDRELAAQGVPDGRATIEELDVDRVRLTGLAAGQAQEFAIASVEIRYSLPDLIDGRIEGIDVEGVALRLDLREGAAPFGSLQPLIDRLSKEEPPASVGTSGPADGGAEPGPPIPDIHLRSSRIDALTPYGDASLVFAGRLEQVGIFGEARSLDLDLDLEMTSPFARLTGNLSAAGDPSNKAEARLAISGGAIELPDAHLQVAALQGDLAITLDAGLPLSGRGDLALEGLKLAGTPFDTAGLRFELSPDQADLEARLSSDDGSVDLALATSLEDLRGPPKGDISLQAEFTEAAPVWSLSPPPFPSAGAGRLEVTATGQWPRLPEASAGWDAFEAWLRQGGLSGHVTADISRLSIPGFDAEVAAVADLAATWAKDELSVTPQGRNNLTVTGLSKADVGALGLAPEIAEELIGILGSAVSLGLPSDSARPSAITFRPGEPIPGATFDGALELAAGPVAAAFDGFVEASLGQEPALKHAKLSDFQVSAAGVEIAEYDIAGLEMTGDFEGVPEAFEAAAQVRARVASPHFGQASAEQVDVVLPLQLSREAERLGVTLGRPGKATVSGLRVAGRLAAPEPVEIVIAGTDAEVTMAGDTNAFTVTHDTRLAVDQTAFLVEMADDPPIPVQIRAPAIAVTGSLNQDGAYTAKATMQDTELTLPDRDLMLGGISLSVDLPADWARTTGRFEVAAARHMATPAAFAPLRIAGEAALEGQRVNLSAQVSDPGGQPLADIAARHDLDAGIGTAEVGLVPLLFAAGGLQPQQLSPLLEMVANVSGAADGSAVLAWNRDALGGTAQLVLDGLAFTTEDMSVKGLELRLDLDSLLPPGSPPSQELSAEVIDVGVALEDIEARFRLPHGTPGQVFVEQAGFSVAGSRFSVRETLFDPFAERTEAQLHVDRLDLAALFDALGIEGLSGSGELTGRIPVMREGAYVTVADARLSSTAPGVLHYSSATAEQALKSGGEYVELLMQALKNFQYETLSLTGALDRDGEAKLRLEILGHNPDVLDGQRFQLNINLTGNLAPILDALRQGHEFSSDFLRRSWRLSP